MHGYTTSVFPYLASQPVELQANVTGKKQSQENDEADDDDDDDDGIISSYCMYIASLSWKNL